MTLIQSRRAGWLISILFAVTALTGSANKGSQNFADGHYAGIFQLINGEVQTLTIHFEPRGRDFHVKGYIQDYGHVQADITGTYSLDRNKLTGTVKPRRPGTASSSLEGRFNRDTNQFIVERGGFTPYALNRIDLYKLATVFQDEKSEIRLTRRGASFEVSGKFRDGTISGIYHPQTNYLAANTKGGAITYDFDGYYDPKRHRLHVRVRMGGVDLEPPVVLVLGTDPLPPLPSKSTGPRPGSPPAGLPATVSLSETSKFGTHATTWTWKKDKYESKWSNGTVSEFTLNSLEGSTITFSRKDTDGASKGLTGTYTGTKTGKKIEGKCTWTFDGWGANKTVTGDFTLTWL